MRQNQLPVPPFDYSDYRVFLSDLIAQWKRDHRRWSYALFSRSVGFAAPNYLKQIIEGKRNLSSKAADKIVNYFSFNSSESSFFKALVNFNQADNDRSRDIALTEMQKFQITDKETQDGVDLHRFYSEWHNPVIREMANIEGFRSDAAWIGASLSPAIPANEAERALRFLKSSGHLVKDESGELIQAEPVNSTGPEIASLAVANYHREMMDLAKESLDRLPSEKRNLSSLTMALSNETYEKIVSEIYQFQDKIIKMAVEDSSPDEVFQLNFQLFPTTEISENRSNK